MPTAPIRSRIAPVALALIGGAMITLVIAVGVAAFPIGRETDYGDPDRADLRLWSRVVPPGFPDEPTSTTLGSTGFGYRFRQLLVDPPAVPSLHIATLVRTGWPVHCLEGAITQDGVVPRRLWFIADHRDYRRWIPLRPNLPAFAANTALCASVLLGAWMSGRLVRRWRRRRRNCCLQCGYRLVGSSACPECGARLQQ